MREGEQEVRCSTKRSDIAIFKVTTIERDSMVTINVEPKVFVPSIALPQLDCDLTQAHRAYVQMIFFCACNRRCGNN